MSSYHFSFLPLPVHCPYQNRKLLITNQKPDHFTAVLFPCCSLPSHSWGIEASRWILCNYISYSILSPFHALFYYLVWESDFLTPFLIIRIKTSKLKQNHLWCWNLCLFLRKFLKNYLSWICWQRMSGAQLLQMSSPLKLIVGVRVWLCWSESNLTWQQKDLWVLVKCYRWVALGSLSAINSLS